MLILLLITINIVYTDIFVMAKVFDAAEGMLMCLSGECFPAFVDDRITVAKHNTPDSCWVILYGKVYDV